jgi:DNA ligase-1
MTKVLVHKAVEPANTTAAGRANYDSLLDWFDRRPRTALPIVQPKYDGVYVQFVFDKSHGWQGFSRTGELLPSVDDTIKDALYSTALKDRRYVGELWLPHTQHAVINGMARKKSPQPLGVRLFDSFVPDEEEPYALRREYLFTSGPVVEVNNLNIADIHCEKDLYDLARSFTDRASAYDGLILRNPWSAHIPGDGRYGGIFKIKPRKTGDFRVIGTTPGKGKHAGKVGALVLDLGGGVTCEVGTGLTDSEREQDGNWVGLIVEVEYLAVTKDGKLREPSFQRIRWDKKTADVLPGNETPED